MLTACQVAPCVSSVVVTDVDGTLLDTNHKIPAATQEILAVLRRRNIPVIPCTGRGPKSFQLVTGGEIVPIYPGIYHHGQIAYDSSGDVVSHTHLQIEAIRALVGYAARTETQLMVYSGDRIFLSAGASDLGTTFCSQYTEPAPEVVDDVCTFMELRDLLPTRAALLSPNPEAPWATIKQEVSALEDESGEALATSCQFRQSLPYLMDITPNSMDKGVALRSLLDSLGLSSDTAVALGDGENDAPLLKGVHMGVSMGNGMSLTKAAARCVTRHVDDDGWSTAVRRFALAEKICSCDLHDECRNS